MKRSLLLSPPAWRDLEAIEDYTVGQWGAVKAEEYIRAIHASFQLLVENPHMGYKQGIYRACMVAQHLAVYRLTDSSVEILNVFHPSMDIQARLRKTKRR